MASTKKRRKIFLNALNAIFQEYKLDGVDYNWEYPTSAKEWGDWALLMKESKAVLSYGILILTKNAQIFDYIFNVCTACIYYNSNVYEYLCIWLVSVRANCEQILIHTYTWVCYSSFPLVYLESPSLSSSVITFTMYLDPNHYKGISMDLCALLACMYCMYVYMYVCMYVYICTSSMDDCCLSRSDSGAEFRSPPARRLCALHGIRLERLDIILRKMFYVQYVCMYVCMFKIWSIRMYVCDTDYLISLLQGLTSVMHVP